MKGLKINRAGLLLQLLIDRTGEKYRLQWEERQKATFIPNASKKVVQRTAKTISSPDMSESDPPGSNSTAADHSDMTMLRFRHLD